MSDPIPGEAPMSAWHQVYISIGSNMGDRQHNCRAAINALTASQGVRVQQQSPFYATAPVDYTDQAWFLNAVVELTTRLVPLALLALLQQIQQHLGRTPQRIRFGPRVIDLDILLYGDFIMESAQLTIPHPRMHKRHFVLKPICDINPWIMHPVLKQALGSLLENLDTRNQLVTRIS
jgi:2-amino-4-hydroxy-6-hydroxymethyldihydropteridine diphosphokinase